MLSLFQKQSARALRLRATPLAAVASALPLPGLRWQSSAPATVDAGGGASGGAGGAGAGAGAPGARASHHPPPRDGLPGHPFLDAARELSRRESQVFRRPAPPAALPPPPEHGLLYGFTDAVLDAAGAPPAVRRALSTRTASAAQARRFRKAQLVARLGGSAADTGCSRVQVSMMTDSLSRLAAHSAAHRHDKAVKRTMQILSSRRAKLLAHMQRTDFESYRLVLRELGLRPVPVVPPRHPPKARKETHAQINARNSRLKRRAGRGDRGH